MPLFLKYKMACGPLLRLLSVCCVGDKMCRGVEVKAAFQLNAITELWWEFCSCELLRSLQLSLVQSLQHFQGVVLSVDI